MLPEALSTGATSLLENADKLAVVTEYIVGPDGSVNSRNVYRAIVRNKAQLAYRAVGAWLEGTAAAPPKVAASSDLQAQLKLQDEAAQALRKRRYEQGALDIDTQEIRGIVSNDQVVDVETQDKNRATELIEDFMIAANGVIARLLEKVSSLRRIVKTPERWDRIVQLAAGLGEKLPADPDSKALNDFLVKRCTGRSRPLRRSIARSHQADRPRRIRCRATRRARPGPLRPRRSGLHSLHRPQPPLCRPGHATTREVGHC